MNLFIGGNFKLKRETYTVDRINDPRIRNPAAETDYLINKWYRAVHSTANPFTYWPADWQNVQQESKDRVNLTTIPISRINYYVIIRVKNQMRESMYFGALKWFNRHLKVFEIDTNKLEK